MNLDQKQIRYIKIISFLLMIGLMVFLNNEQKSSNKDNSAESTINISKNDSGLASNSAKIPEKTEGSIPLKLISNPNSNLLFLLNNCRKSVFDSRYVQLQKLYLGFCSKTRTNFLIEYLATMRNKDIKWFENDSLKEFLS